MKKRKYDYHQYPPHQGLRVGCKVSWYYYDKEDDAKAASSAAQHNARIQADQGYDFGYQSPGSIRRIDAGEFAGKLEVCIP